MPYVARVGRQLRSLIWKASVEDEVDAELAFHLEMRTREYVARGMTPDEARAAALNRFGDIDEVNHTCRDIGERRDREMRTTEWLGELRQDFAFGARQLLKNRGFTAAAALTLALGIGPTAAIFGVVQAVVLRPYPFDASRLLSVSESWRGEPGGVSVGNFSELRRESTSFVALAALQLSPFNLAEGGQPERVVGARVSQSFFAAMGGRPALGRVFLPEEDAPGREHVTVLSHRLWVRRFGSDPAVLGREIRLSGAPYTVVGVMPASFDMSAESEELWVPIAFTPKQLAMYDEHYLEVYGLLKPGVARERAGAEVDAIGRRLAERHPAEDADRSFTVRPLIDVLVGEYRQRLFVLLGAVGFVLLIACSNVANLLLARGRARAKELAIRTALGAGRGRIVRQLLTESLVLALLGAALGLALAYGGVRLLVAWSPPGVPRIEQARIDGAVLLFTLGIALASSLTFGLVPALRAARPDLQGTLKEGGRAAGTGSARDRVRNVLVVAEVALSLTLLVGAGLLIRSAIHLQRVPLGFDPANVLSARVALPKAEYEDPARAREAFEQIVAGLERAPGVRAAAALSQGPLLGGGNTNGLNPEGRPMDLANTIDSRLSIITPRYFDALRIPLRRGRAFTERDVAGGPRVMIVSERLARIAWPGEDPIGKRIACCEGSPEDPRWKEVVGVAGDTRWRGPAETNTEPEFYLPMAQAPAESWDWIQRAMTLVARGTTDAASLAAPMRQAVRTVNPSLPLYRVATMHERLRDALAQARFNTFLLGTLGVIGLLLAAVGIYGVIAYFVSLRTHEIGIRMALGASARQVLSLMARQGMRLVLAGVALGVVAALAATRVLRSSLAGVTTTDPLTFAGVVAALVAVGLLASYIPARRATRVNPTRALHEG